MPESSLAAPHRRPKIDFKKELESASRGMIMIHDPKLLIKLILRMIVRKLQITHAGMVLYDPDHNAYVLSISRGETGMKIPPGFARFTSESPLIKLFTCPDHRMIAVNRQAIVMEDINQLIWREHIMPITSTSAASDLLNRVRDQMEMLNTTASVPAYYQKKLMAILLLGEKHDKTKYTGEELDFFAALASDAAMAVRNAQLFRGLQNEAQRNRQLFIQTISVLSSTIEAKDPYTHGHTERVTGYAIAIAKSLEAKGLKITDPNFYENLHVGALLHDIGKIGIPESILLKNSSLTNEERDIICRHPLRGAEIIRPLSLPLECVEGIMYHHERYDGKGYPFGLKGKEIPLIAAIIAVADSYDAMTTDRPYRKGMDKYQAIKELKANIGTQFDPYITDIMLRLLSLEDL
jgi:putative nucleotidyltransferase with HDIG domain